MDMQKVIDFVEQNKDEYLSKELAHSKPKPLRTESRKLSDYHTETTIYLDEEGE